MNKKIIIGLCMVLIVASVIALTPDEIYNQVKDDAALKQQAIDALVESMKTEIQAQTDQNRLNQMKTAIGPLSDKKQMDVLIATRLTATAPDAVTAQDVYSKTVMTFEQQTMFLANLLNKKQMQTSNPNWALFGKENNFALSHDNVRLEAIKKIVDSLSFKLVSTPSAVPSNAKDLINTLPGSTEKTNLLILLEKKDEEIIDEDKPTKLTPNDIIKKLSISDKLDALERLLGAAKTQTTPAPSQTPQDTPKDDDASDDFTNF